MQERPSDRAGSNDPGSSFERHDVLLASFSQQSFHSAFEPVASRPLELCRGSGSRPDGKKIGLRIFDRLWSRAGYIGIIDRLTMNVAPSCVGKDVANALLPSESEWARGFFDRLGLLWREIGELGRPIVVSAFTKAGKDQPRVRKCVTSKIAEGGNGIIEEHGSMPGNQEIGLLTFGAPVLCVAGHELEVMQVTASCSRNLDQIGAHIYAGYRRLLI